MNLPQPCVILAVGGEGGDITLCGLQTAGHWRFILESIDQSESFFNDSGEPGDSYRNNSRVVDSWPEALKLFDTYPWHQLYPLEVHPDFREAVFDTVFARFGSKESDRWGQLSRWREVCGMPDD